MLARVANGSGFNGLCFLMIFMRIDNQTMSAKDKYYHSLTSHEDVVCEIGTSKKDWRELKDYFAIAATSLNV